jgi:hypothetical protein
MRGAKMETEAKPNTGAGVLRMPGMAWRISGSIAVFFGWLVFLIIWLFFFASDYDVFQNIAIIIVSILVSLGILAAMWVPWGLRYADSFEGGTMKDKPKWTSVLSGIAGLGWLIFLIIWLFFYASDFTGYQNIAIVLVSILVLAGILGGAWAYWGLRFGTRCGKDGA